MTTKADLAINNPFERLLRSTAYKSMAPTQKLDAMLHFKSFPELLQGGNIFDVQGASQRSGYTPQHVRRLCREDRLGCITRGLPDSPDEVQFFFLPEQLTDLFSYRKAKAQA